MYDVRFEPYQIRCKYYFCELVHNGIMKGNSQPNKMMSPPTADRPDPHTNFKLTAVSTTNKTTMAFSTATGSLTTNFLTSNQNPEALHLFLLEALFISKKLASK